MSNHEIAIPMKAKFITRGTSILMAIAGAGIAVYLYRLLFGLKSVTNLTDQYPWGIWISIDVATGVALAAGGFTTAALVYIFHNDKYHTVIRPALLTAMLGRSVCRHWATICSPKPRPRATPPPALRERPGSARCFRDSWNPRTWTRCRRSPI